MSENVIFPLPRRDHVYLMEISLTSSGNVNKN